MSEFAAVLLLALLPAAGNFAGGVLAEVLPASRRMLSHALHVAAGVLVGVVAIELMPEALAGTTPPWVAVVGLSLGGIFYVFLEWALDAVQGEGESAGKWMIYAAVAIDLFSDGLMIGIGSVISWGLALILAIGQVAADIPEGFAAIAIFRDKGIKRSRRLLLSASFAIPALLGATLGYWLLRGQSENWQRGALAFTAGILVIAAVEELIGEAHAAADDTREVALCFIGGFALFTLVATYFGP